MELSTSSKKDLSIVTPLITAKRDQVSFFYQDGSFLGHFLIFIFNLIFYPLQFQFSICAQYVLFILDGL